MVLSYESLVANVLGQARADAKVTAHYKSAVWAQNAEQEVIASRVALELGKEKLVLPSSSWTEAEAHHQRAFAKAEERAAALAAAPPAQPPPLVRSPPVPPPPPLQP